jgi:iron complex outermembrane receptor protein
MKKFILLFITAINITFVSGQNTFKAVVKDSQTKETLIGATAVLQGTTFGATANAEGIIEIKNIPGGQKVIVFTYIGYETRMDTFNFPLATNNPIEILLSSEGEELEGVVVSSTRRSRTIDNIPTRMETISGEELEEKGNMKPGDIRMILNESTGIQTQQTSATSYN